MTTQFFMRMTNVIQDYAWGTVDSISRLFGIANPENKPQAEIWMGAHPNGCSEALAGNELVRLDQFIADHPQVLGEGIGEQFGGLPYLFKVLAAEKALSIQVHPSKQQAEAGFAREEEQGVPLSAGHRNYKDPNHKPELVYALTPYQAMNGFRSYGEILDNFQSLDIAELDGMIEAFAINQNAQGLETFFVSLLKLSGVDKDSALEQLLAYADKRKEEETFALILDLKDQYQGDIGLFSPLFLHVLTLEPGQAMFLDACTPHAYIKGTGLEIMANSDNVLRAGLTPKHMDIEELAACTLFEPKPAASLLTTPETEGTAEHFPVPVADFKFSVYQAEQGVSVNAVTAEIILAVDAPMTLTHANGESLEIEKGHSAFVSAEAGEYQVKGEGRFARAFC